MKKFFTKLGLFTSKTDSNRCEPLDSETSDNFVPFSSKQGLTEYFQFGSVEVVMNVVSKYLGSPARTPIQPRDLSETLKAWMTSDPKNRESELEIRNILGFAFGEYLVAAHGFEWGFDESQGSRIGLLHAQSKLRIFPYHDVEKSILEGKPFSFQMTAALIDAEISRRA